MSQQVRRRGLTLAEVVVAIGILAVAGLSVMSVFVKMVGAQSKSGHQVVARMLAEQVLERGCLDGPPYWGMGDKNVDLESTEMVELEGALQPVPFVCKLNWKVLRQAKTVDPLGELYGLDVTVTWEQDGPDQPSRERGRSSHTARRVVYIERQ